MVQVLVADDSSIIQGICIALLQGSGIEVVVARNGWDALTQLERSPFDLVLMDVEMPSLDGVRTTEIIRRNPALKHLPVIALTTHSSDEMLTACLAAGMNDHIAKPIDPDRLDEILGRWLRCALPPPAEATTPVACQNLPGIDVAAGLRAVNGDCERFLALVASFSRDFPDCAGHLAQLATAERWGVLASFAHAVRGSASTVGAMALARAASEVEKKARERERGVTPPLPLPIDVMVAECRVVTRASAMAEARRPLPEHGCGRRPLAEIRAELGQLVTARQLVPSELIHELREHVTGATADDVEGLIIALERIDYREASRHLQAMEPA